MENFEELSVALDMSLNRRDVLERVGSRCEEGYFVITDDGECYLFDRNGNRSDIRKIKILCEHHIRKDIKKIKIPNSVTSIKTNAFYYCSGLTNVTIGNGVMNIRSYAFFYCSGLMSVMIPDSVMSIGAGVFSYCSSLTNVMIPDSVTSIGYHAFFDCINLVSVIFKGKTINQVKVMPYYPWGINDISIIRCEA